VTVTDARAEEGSARVAPFDIQDERPDGERLEAATSGFVQELGRAAAIGLDACIRCGHCAEACQFYAATRDPRYTPTWKLEPFRNAWKRERGPFRWLNRLLKRKVTLAQLEEWQELVYDSCTLCGRCTAACPMGIDIAALVGQARHAMFRAGLVPRDLYAVAERAEREGSPLGATPKVLRERLEWLADEHEVPIPLDLPLAQVLVTLSSIEIMKYPLSVVAIARVLKRSGYVWTIASGGYEATNFGMLSGNVDWQRETTVKIIEAAVACGAGIVLMPECGHAYTAMRWQGAEMWGKPLPFRVLHVSEFLAECIERGRIDVKPMAGTVAFHDPCQVSRRGGAMQAPRSVLAALGLELRETEDHGELSYCCGGGGGVIANRRADGLRRAAFAIKLRQIEATGAERAVTSCANCRQSFDDGEAFHGRERRMGSLLELVAAQLA
jgi:Fe-S oxidoreductase